jgi:formylglycine-generating enzyme required for sulfatase activity
VTPDLLERVLRRRVGPATPVDELGQVWWLLEQVGRRPASAEFFQQAGRPVEKAPRLVAVAVPEGKFLMGSPDDEPERYDDEGPQRRVRVHLVWMCRTAVTNAEYLRFDPAHEVEAWEGRDPGDLAAHPVVNVSWWAARLYCCWLGDDVRLPSEAEWEYACRAGTTTPFSFGEDITPEQVNHDGNYPYRRGKKGLYRERTVPVGSLPANAWGLHEMHGNVWEWCEDWRSDYTKAPSDGSPQRTAHGSGYRVLRGGSWIDYAGRCRSASRFGNLPAERWRSFGFRPASSSPGSFTTSPPPT